MAPGTERLREGSKRDSSTTRADTFAGSEREEKASARFGRNDKFAIRLAGEAVEDFAGAVELVELFFFGAEFGGVGN